MKHEFKSTAEIKIPKKIIDQVIGQDAAVEVMKKHLKIEKRDVEIASKAFIGEQKNAELVCGICSIRDSIKRIADCAAIVAEIAVNRGVVRRLAEQFGKLLRGREPHAATGHVERGVEVGFQR